MWLSRRLFGIMWAVPWSLAVLCDEQLGLIGLTIQLTGFIGRIAVGIDRWWEHRKEEQQRIADLAHAYLVTQPEGRKL